MAAGLGFKTFTTGEVLTAADTNGYLMQGINVFASTAARDAAITSPQEGQFAFTKDTNGLWYYDGAAWVASGATGDIEGVTAGIGISGGGTSGTVTVTNSMATAIDAKGDLVPGTGADTFSRLAVGANNTVLTADSAQATGMKWATPAAAASGLTFISGATFTSVAAVSAPNSSFTSTYTNYRVIFTLTSAPTDIFYMRLRASGSDNTTSQYYTGQNRINYSGTRSDYGGSGASSINLGTTSGSPPEWTQFILDFMNPQVALMTTINIFGSTGSIVSTTGVGAFNATTAFDSFSLLINSSTISGNYRIYGYQNS